MRRISKWKVVASLLAAATAATSRGQTVINGNSMLLKSSGAVSNSTGWTLSSDGYLGTYIQVPSAGATVSFDINANGTASNGVSPDLTLSVAGTNDPFTITPGSNGDYVASVTLPGDSNSNALGTYAVRVQLDNQTSTATPTAILNNLTITGATVDNSTNSNTIALDAAQTYADKFRAGPGTITLKNSNGIHLGAGTSVQVKLISNAFNFAGAVYGQSPFSSPPAWMNWNSNGQNLAPTTSEETNYQNAIKANFNAIVPGNLGKWVNNEFTQGQPTMSVVDAMDAFASQNGLRIRMHNLIWATEQPSYISSMFNSGGTFTGNLTTLNNDITSRIGYYVSGKNSTSLNIPRADSYTEMDVMNEPFNGQNQQVNYLGALGISGSANVFKQVATAVTAAGANTRLYTNEYNVLQFSPASISNKGVESGSDPYANWYLNGIQSIQRAGGPISGIGMEMYVGSTAVSAATMQQALGNLSVAKDPNGNPIPLSLTEFGANGSPSISTYDTSLQTALAMAYGNPQTTTFGYWGGIGGPNDKGSDGTGNYDLYSDNSSYTLTTTGAVWQAFQAQYNTNLTLTTDANGNISFNGTYGTYQVTVGGQNYTLNLVPGTSTYGLMTPIGASTWVGGGRSSNWSNLVNWASSTFGANSALVFTGTTGLAPNNDSTAGNQFNGMTFNSGAGAFVITGNAISLGGDIVNNSTNVQTVNLNLALLQNTNFNAAAGNLAIGGNISGAFTVTKIGSNTLTLSGTNTYSNGTAVNAGKLVIGAAAALPTNTAVAITGPGTMQLSSGIGVQILSSLTLMTGGLLDITNNALIIHNGNMNDIPIQLKSGFNSAGGYWNGALGIVSSTAANDTTYMTTIGYGPGGNPLDSVNTVASDVLVKYTYYGDANLDGTVNGADYQQIDNGFGLGLTGWSNGDFNYDGVIDGSDFSLIDNSFNQITATGVSPLVLSAGSANLIASLDSQAVPEPASLVLLGFGAIGLLGRRRQSPFRFGYLKGRSRC